MTKFKTKHKAHALRKTGGAALITAAVLTLALLFTGCKQSTGSSGGGNSGGGNSGSSPIEGVWKGVSATSVISGVTQTDNFPVQCEDPDNSGNTGAKRQSYMCFQSGWVYNADEFSGMSVPEKNGLVGEESSQSYTLSGNTLTMEGTEFTVSYPSSGRLELKTVEAGGDSHTLLFEKTTDYTAEQISAAPVTGCAVLILSSDKPAIKVQAYTSDHSPVTVAGCTQTSLAHGTETELNAKGRRVVLKGKITILECNENRLAALNVEGLSALRSLECTGNQLTELNIRNLSALTALKCGGNRLTSLDAQGLSTLVRLYCGENQLDTLNIQGCTDLQTLLCGTNQLTSLDAQGLTALKELYCPKNQLATLNVQGCTSLQTLHCYTNQLTSLDIHGLTALKELSGGGNRLTSLNVQGCTALQELACSTNQLTALNVQGLTLLQKLVCYNNQLTTLSVQGLTALQTLRCNGNKLASLNVKNLSALKELYCNDNQLTTLTVQGCTALEALECNGNGLTSLNVQNCPALYRLYCDRNKLNAQAFTKIFGDLPSVTIGFCVLYTEKAGVSEGNHTDFTAPPALQSAFQNAKTVKKWKMYKYDTAGEPVEM